VSPNSNTTFSVTGYKNGCSGSASVTVFVNPKPNVTCAANPSIITLGLASTLTASGALTYQWSTGAIGSSILVVPLLTTSYSVTGTDANGCSNTASTTVTVSLLGVLGGRTASDTNGSTGIEESDKQASVFPNPTEGALYLSNVPQNANVEIFNFNGDRLLSTQVKDVSKAIDLRSYQPGLYYVRINFEGQLIFQSRVIKH
jgi:hypothetical protein